MFSIKLQNCGKRYNFEWIFRGISLDLESGHRQAILGSNGSGKSTLLQIISSRSIASEGSVEFFDNSELIETDKVYRHITLSAPYLELPEEFTLRELLDFHFSLKSPYNDLTPEEITEILRLKSSRNKPLRYYSSGMKQRVKLGLAILTRSDLLLLDEPCTNLDKAGMEWYRNLVETYANGRIIVVCSNHQAIEYDFCDKQILIDDFKPRKA
ncbi:MAG: ABC transporter ATP-binding protein [Bacteroidales bacterium]|nr:ABC transporter ATP-binding protein [Bacteroidales bacterium]